jgi:hypothetical protein
MGLNNSKSTWTMAEKRIIWQNLSSLVLFYLQNGKNVIVLVESTEIDTKYVCPYGILVCYNVLPIKVNILAWSCLKL